MAFDALLGNEQLKENLRQSIRRGHISHFYLISGPNGSGKHTLARLLAMAILCRGEERPCGNCLPCRKVLSGNHPDFITVDEPEKKTVSVDLIRQTRSDMYVRPNESEHKIYLFPRAQDMGIPGQNALLKILEEPPAYGVFLLLTDNPEKLLPTVRSRCTELNLRAIPEGTLFDALRQAFPEKEPQAIRAAMARSGGYLGQAKQLLEEGGELPAQTVRLMESLAGRDSLGIAETLCSMEKWKRDQLIPVLQQWEALLQEALTAQCGLGGTQALAERLSVARSSRELLHGIRCLQKAAQYAQANVSCATICGYLTWALQLS